MQGRKILQIHPSAFCNFTCVHCYSSSLPSKQFSLPKEGVLNLIAEAANMGFDKLSISGGEPMLLPYLEDLLEEGKNRGMSVSMITNGSFPEKKYQKLKNLVDVVGVSIDGHAKLHNAVRESNTSFEKIEKFLDFGFKYFPQIGITHTLSDQSWDNIPSLLEFGKNKNINLFQIHPLEDSGRATNQKVLTLSEDNLKRAYLQHLLLKQYYEFDIQFNALSSTYILKNQEQLLPSLNYSKMSEAIDLLVLEDNGKVVPYTYGLNDEFSICNIKKNCLSSGWREFVENKRLNKLYNNVKDLLNLIAKDGSFQIMNYNMKLRSFINN